MHLPWPACRIILAVVACLAMCRSAAALELDVPGTHATLQLAVAAAAVSPDVDNTITISVSPVSTAESVTIGGAFGPARKLVIRPAPALARATVVNTNPVVPIFDLTTAGEVTLQDLDLLRNITNGYHLVTLSVCENVVIERCRIGSNWVSTGTTPWANVFMIYPTGVILRNNILFAHAPGTFDWGINAGSFNDPANSLRLYNNVVTDYRTAGIRIEAAIPGPLVLLRNNVVANHPGLAPEPTAFHTLALVGGPTVVSSHNAVFASAGFVQMGPGGTQDIAGLGASFLQFATGDVATSFDASLWAFAPPWDDNPDFFRLTDGGDLHDGAGDYGMNVGNAAPDVAVVDDIEGDVRPGGPGPHTDRGADQIEPGSAAGVLPTAPPRDSGLRLSVRRAGGGGLTFEWASAPSGRLRLALYDVAGRMLHADERTVTAGSRGTFEWAGPATGAPRVVFYRLRLFTPEGPAGEVSGKALVGR